MSNPFRFRFAFMVSLGLLLPGAHLSVAQTDVAETEVADADATENKGQADLDAATALKLSVSSMADLEKVVALCESAIEKGLDPGSEELAKSLLTATLLTINRTQK